MSIQDLREKLVDKVPGAAGLTMRYEDGGRVQVFTVEGKEVRLGPTVTVADIEAAFSKVSA